ncbi:MAG: adenosylcobinamide-GDP ribazoletransferase, partial [Oscillospiraceae bacterium]|nr:adenosylcobinamide-GDP ribazoletransferase [Oscillospiraceae bacterium]
MKSWVNAFLIALSMYSTIPVKILDWNQTNLRHAMVFFPFVGIFCGISFTLIWFLLKFLDIGAFLSGVLAILSMILMTGAIHLDGFCDTADALYSRRSQEEKLKILKDPHCGAFAVIAVVLVLLLQTAGYAELFKIYDDKICGILTGGFVLSRCLSGISVMSFPCAPTSSLAKTFQEYAASGSRKLLILELILTEIVLIYCFRKLALILIFLASLVFFYYHQMQKKE